MSVIKRGNSKNWYIQFQFKGKTYVKSSRTTDKRVAERMEREWKVKIHGRGRPRKWIKVHIALDVESQEIVAHQTTTSRIGDGPMTKPLLDQVKGKIQAVLADGAYDGGRFRDDPVRGHGKVITAGGGHIACEGNDLTMFTAFLEACQGVVNLVRRS